MAFLTTAAGKVHIRDHLAVVEGAAAGTAESVVFRGAVAGSGSVNAALSSVYDYNGEEIPHVS